jgi:putative heme iron utilization protein
MTDNDALSSYKSELKNLLENRSVLMLATLGDEFPEASSAPFLYYESCFWVYVSRLSSHTANLLTHKKASLLIAIDEADAPNPFTLTRLTIKCSAHEEVGEKQALILDKMESKLGDTVKMLRQLPDFHLVRLTPCSGRFIAGFGKAFDINFSDMSLHHVKP